MKNFLTALASALLVAVIVTSLHYYVFSDDLNRAPLALFFLSFIGMAVVALFNVRQSALRSGLAPAAAATAAAGTAAQGRNRTRNRNQDGARSANNKGGRGGQRERKDNRGSGDRPPRKDAASGAASKPAPSVPDGPRETGTVKWFNRSKGFGFIVRENGEEIFVHHRSIRNSDESRRSNLRDGQTVNYVVADHTKGQQAEDVVGE